jgi:glycosyltransferase involved in cell wall biosynthesis
MDPIPYYMLMLDRARRSASEFDIIHFHIDYLHFPLFRYRASSTVTTLHGRQDLPDIKPIFHGFDDMPLVSISRHQRTPVLSANFSATIYHGLPLTLMKPNYQPKGGYLAFIGRISAEKRPDRAIEIARRLGIPLKIAAKVDRADETYFRETIVPLLNGPDVEFVGEINEQNKNQFLGNALGLLFPIDWPEPFGLVMIEAMACGTPVLAFRCGSVPEVIDEGVSGMIVESIEDAVAAIPKLLKMNRGVVRKCFEDRFSAARMARDYVNLYRKLADISVRQETAKEVRVPVAFNPAEAELIN